MAIYLLDGRLCPALFLDEFNPDGTARRAVYFYSSTEGKAGAEQRISDSLVNAADYQTWTPADYPHGAHFYLIVADDANLQGVLDYLTAAYNHREQCAAAAQAGNTAGTGTEVGDDSGDSSNAGDRVPPPVVDDRPEWQKAGFASKADWKKAKQ